MASGKLHYGYSFQERVDSADGFGNAKGEWEERFQARGKRKYFRGRDKVIAAGETGTQMLILTVRKSEQSSKVTSAWRVVDTRSNETYNVRTSEDSENRQYIDFAVESGVADG